MKKILSFLGLMLVFAGEISGAILQSSVGALIAGVASDFNPMITIGVGCTIMAFNLFSPEGARYAYVTFTRGICPTIQRNLIDFINAQGTSVKRTQVGYLLAITSPLNTAGTQQIPIDLGDGKIHSVRLKYTQRGTEADITNTRITDCTTTIEKVPFQQDIDVDQYIATAGIKFTEAEMKKLCEPQTTWMAEIVMNKRLITLQSVNFGTFNGGATSKNVQLLDASNKSAPVYYGESTILEDFAYLDTVSKPIVIGAGYLSHYVRQVGIGCCNSLGQDIGQAGNLDFFHDRFVGTILGNANAFIALVPGYIQLLTYNEYAGTYSKENDVFSHGTIVDPFTGIRYDMKWHYNDCNDTYFLQIGLNYDLHFLPNDAFAYGDELNGVNFSLKYIATNA